MSTQEKKYSYWSSVQLPEEMDFGRFFEYSPKNLQEIKQLLQLEKLPAKGRILEIGGGSGFFTNILSQIIPKSVILTTIEPDLVLATYLNKKFLKNGSVTVFQAVGEEIPFYDNAFDHVTAHIVLSNLPNPRKILKEMVRVTANNGLVSLIEPLKSIVYFPDKVVNDLYHKTRDWWSRGYWILRQKELDYSNYPNNFNLRTVEFFESIELKNVQLNTLSNVFRLSDPSIPLEVKLKWLKQRINLLKKTKERDYEYMIAGGGDSAVIDLFFEEFEEYLVKLIHAPETIQTTHELEIILRSVTIGQKRKK